MLLTDLYGIGPSLAARLTELMREAKLWDGKRELSETELRDVLQHSLIYGSLPLITKMDLLYRPLRRIPRALIDVIAGELTKAAPIFAAHHVRWIIAGSYIRGKASSGDIDMVVVGKGEDWLAATKEIHSDLLRFVEPFAQGEEKIGMLFGARYGTSEPWQYVKVDIFLTNERDYIYALLYAIGSGRFNVAMRATAKRKGYLLNQHGLFRDGKRLPIDNERDIFKELGMTYREPSERG